MVNTYRPFTFKLELDLELDFIHNVYDMNHNDKVKDIHGLDILNRTIIFLNNQFPSIFPEIRVKNNECNKCNECNNKCNECNHNTHFHICSIKLKNMKMDPNMNMETYAYTKIIESNNDFPTKSEICINTEKSIWKRMIGKNGNNGNNGKNGKDKRKYKNKEYSCPLLRYILLHEIIHAMGILSCRHTKPCLDYSSNAFQQYCCLVCKHHKNLYDVDENNLEDDDNKDKDYYDIDKIDIVKTPDKNHIQHIRYDGKPFHVSNFFSSTPNRNLDILPFLLLYDYGYNINLFYLYRFFHAFPFSS